MWGSKEAQKIMRPNLTNLSRFIARFHRWAIFEIFCQLAGALCFVVQNESVNSLSRPQCCHFLNIFRACGILVYSTRGNAILGTASLVRWPFAPFALSSAA
jgi:hypothetical protein